jgi:hypothetical protein
LRDRDILITEPHIHRDELVTNIGKPLHDRFAESLVRGQRFEFFFFHGSPNEKAAFRRLVIVLSGA